ncbi:MAG: heme biosynthesis protein HemY [Azovibrio sp.]|nr:heme biosynthesis protein HemY [Azovibrio sp.]
MRGIFWFLGLSFLAVALALLARYNDGFVLLVLPPWRVEMSLNFVILLLGGGFVFAYLLLRGVLFSIGLPERARAYRAQRQREQVARVLEAAIRLLFEGRYGQALRRAEAAWQAGHAPSTAALIAARAAQRLREDEKARVWLSRASEAAPESAAAALMLAAELAIERGDYVAALRDLQRLQREHGRHIAALRLELRARQGLGDSEGVLKLLRQLEKRAALPPEMAAALRRQAHREALRQRQADAAALFGYFTALPPAEQEPELVLDVARRLHALGAGADAALLAEAGLERHAWGLDTAWATELITLYGELASHDERALTARIAKAEAWLAREPRHAALLLTLGRLCERLRLWGKARSYFEAALAHGAGSEAHLALARMLDHLGETEQANHHFRQAAERDTL